MDGNKPRVTEPQPKSSQLGAAVTPDSQPTEGGAEVELGRPEGGRGGEGGVVSQEPEHRRQSGLEQHEA
jgi:hypothetical protein